MAALVLALALVLVAAWGPAGPQRSSATPWAACPRGRRRRLGGQQLLVVGKDRLLQREPLGQLLDHRVEGGAREAGVPEVGLAPGGRAAPPSSRRDEGAWGEASRAARRPDGEALVPPGDSVRPTSTTQ